MALKNIISVIAIAGLMFSCVSEDIVGPYADNGGKEVIDGLPTTLSLTLSPGKIATKAIGEEMNPYQYATTDELFVGEAAVAIFDVDADNNPTTLRAYKHITNPAPTATATDTLAWEVTGIQVTTGKAHILVVANLPESKLNAAYPTTLGTTTYADFKTLIATESFGNTFDPKTLVKVGELQTTLSTDNNVIEIPMVQLAAKVNYTINVNIPIENSTAEINFPEETKNILDLFGKGNINYAQNYSGRVKVPSNPQPGQTVYYGFNCKVPRDGNHYPDIASFLFNGQLRTVTGLHSEKVLEIGVETPGTGLGGKGLAVDSVFSTTLWKLHINSITVNKINTESDVIIEGFNKQVSLVGSWFDTVVDSYEYVDNYTISFYTYEMAQSTNASDELTITLDCKLEKGTDKVIKRYYASMHAVWVTSAGAVTSWGSSNAYLFVPLVLENPVRDDSISEEPVFENITEHISKTFKVKVNDVAPIEHGNLYDLHTEMKSSFTTKAASDITDFGLLVNRSSMPWTR